MIRGKRSAQQWPNGLTGKKPSGISFLDGATASEGNTARVESSYSDAELKFLCAVGASGTSEPWSERLAPWPVVRRST
jgi:hypothetical protein